MIFDQPNKDYVNSGTINDGVSIAASGIRLSNTNGAFIYGGISFTAGGSSLINQFGGTIGLSETDQSFSAVIVTGSTGDDMVTNAGRIAGRVGLGEGNDVYLDRDGTAYGIDLGAGDDVYRVEGSRPSSLSATGGDGRDLVVIAATGYQYGGAYLTGFEDLLIEASGNYTQFSNYLSLRIASGNSFVNFVDCLNPTLDVGATTYFSMVRSSFRSITSEDGAQTVDLGRGSAVSIIALGAGDDNLVLTDSGITGVIPVIGSADGGSGTDTLKLAWFNGGGTRSYDLGFATGFERLWVNSERGGLAATSVSITNAARFSEITIGSNISLTISENLSATRVGGGTAGTLLIQAGATIGSYAPPASTPGYTVDLERGDPAFSTRIDNHGSIVGDVKFFAGDDRYDGTSGSVGGTVYGNAGNDTLLGGAGVERFLGGFGDDILTGGGGADVLTGGAGADLFRDSAAGLSGDTITDFAASDRIVITDAAMAGFTYSLSGNTLVFNGGSLTLGTVPAGRIAAVAALGGGVELFVADAVRDDFNGDGRSDILWRHDSGSITDWLGQANGGLAGNAASVLSLVDPAWQVAGTGDFNGDGRSDIIWRHGSGGFSEWLGQSNGDFVSNHSVAGQQVAAGWHVAGTGDFNGDGRDDVLWRNDNGALTNWLGQASGGFVANTNAANQIGNDWQIASTGDFNGDGRGDILWRNSSGTLAEWLGQANGGFVGNAAVANSVDASWHLLGSGDFDGDGRDDILWRNDSGALAEWLGQANGGFVGNAAVANQVDRGWHVADLGDYDGDGRDDILWRNDNGAVAQWLGQANGGFVGNGAANYQVDSSWKIQSPDILLL